MKLSFPFFFFFFLILFSTSVLAIGISPPIINAEYEEGVVYEFDVRIINNAGSTPAIQLSANGPFSEFVTFSETNFVFEKNEVYHEVQVSVALPDYDDLAYFGKKRINLRASEGVPSNSGNMFSVITAVTGWFVIDIPVPGKYAVIDSLDIKNTVKNNDADFSLTIRNRGTQSLSGASAKVYVKDYENNILDTLSFQNIYIPLEGEYVLSNVLPTSSYDSSKYYALAEFTFDSQKAPASLERSFFVGSTDIELVSHTHNISSNTINKVYLELQSLWASPLKNIRGSIEYEGGSQALPVLDFASFEKKTITAFIDLPVVNDSVLDAKLILDIPIDGRNEFHKELPVQFVILDETPNTRESPLSGSSLMFGGIILIILILIGVNVFVFMKRKK